MFAQTKSIIRKFLIGIFILSVVVRFAIPEDLFTSAYAADHMDMQQTFPTLSHWFGAGTLFPTMAAVTNSAIGFSLFLFALQLALGYDASVRKMWGKSQKDGKGPVRNLDNWMQLLIAVIRPSTRKTIKDFSYAKLLVTSGYWAIAFVDTWFDASYKSLGGMAFSQAFWISFLYYSIGSEFGLVLGLTWVVESGQAFIGILRGRHRGRSKSKKQHQQRVPNDVPSAPPTNGRRRRRKRQS